MSDDRELERMRDAAISVADDEDELPPPGGFADVLVRARALEAEAAPDDLEPLIVAARRVALRDIEERDAEGLPTMRRTATSRFAGTAAIVLLAAASALLVIGGLSWIAERNARQSDSQAAMSLGGGGVAEGPTEHETESKPKRGGTPRPNVPAQLEAADTSGGAIEPAPLEEPSRVKRSNIEERLRALADAAEVALGRGELQRADDLLAKLVAIGGRHRLVELAYGDRFTIAHRRGIIGEQTKLWRAYLQRFPRGRFADDARAGLCRHAPQDARASCWQRYLDEFPSGAYQAAARRAIGGQ